MVGHPGFGGQEVYFDMKNKLAVAYLTNSLKGYFGSKARTFKRLNEALYKCID